MPPPALSVVIPAYNQAPLLRRTLETLLRQDLATSQYEVIVVDDGSTDETAEVVRERAAREPRVRLLRQETNRGRSAARNAGVQAAGGDIILFTDSDILVRPDFLARHLETHRQSRRPVLCRGPVVDIPDGRLPEHPAFVPPSPAYLTTANASLPRGELLAAGLFDENFRAYGWEDFDLGFRLQRRGLPRVYRREAIAYHILPASGEENFAEALRKEEERARTALYLYQKHPGWQTRVLIQDTLLHRLLYFVQAGGGLLHRGNVPAIGAALRRHGRPTLEYLLLRGVLNRHYLQTLRRERRRARAA